MFILLFVFSCPTRFLNMSNLQNQITNLLSSLCVFELIYKIILKDRHLIRFSCD